MEAYELFKQMNQEIATNLLGWFREEERDVYRSVIAQLAEKRRLRPVFVTKKSRTDQFAWMHKTLSSKVGNELGEHLLQIWLLKGRTDMLKAFLKDLDIAHDDDGSVEDLPEEIDPAALGTAVDNLLATYPAWEVCLYLHMFNEQAGGGWKSLSALLESDQRLVLRAA